MRRSFRFRWISASFLAALLVVAPLTAVAAAPGKIAAADLHQVLLSVSVNREPASEPVALLRGPDNQLYATTEQLASWRIKHGGLPTVFHGGDGHYLVNAISGVTVELDEATQTLSIIALPDILQSTRLSYAPVDISDEVVGGTGGFVNYDISAQLAHRENSVGGTFEAGVFSKWGVGIASFVGRWSGKGTELVRLDTHWTIDDPARMRSLRFGDAITRGGVGGNPLRFSGIQLARNFAVQPGFVTIPLPSLSGSAALPSVVDIYVNDALRDSRSLRPGPFEITELPIITGSGDVQLIVRDLLGREQLFTQSYYASSSLLRRGLHDYSYEVGFLRRSFGQKSHDYGPLMLSATHRYGVSDKLTAEAHVEASKTVQTAGLAANLVLGSIGHVEITSAASRSAIGEGLSGGIRLERRTRGLSLALSANLNSSRFTSLGWTLERRAPASILQAFAGIPLGSGSVGLSYVRRDSRIEPDVQYASANASLRLGKLASLHLAARKSVMRNGDLSANVAFVLPLGQRTSSSAGAAVTNNRLIFNTAVQRNVPVGQGVGYDLTASSGDFERIRGRVTAHTNFGAHEGQLSWTDGRMGVRISTAGGLGTVKGDIFTSRKLDQSFAIVKVGDYQNVRVYADNQLVGRTNRRGTVIIPKLRPYDRNRLQIEVADLPLDADVSGDEQTVRPYGRHGILVDFDVNPSRAALVRVLLDGRTPLPAGSLLKLRGQHREFVSAPGGDVYLTGLSARNVVVASWNGGSCSFELPFIALQKAKDSREEFRCVTSVQ